MSIIHIDYQGKSARVQLQMLPKANTRGSVETSTSSGPVSGFRVRNGVRKFNATQLPTLADLRDGDPELEVHGAGSIASNDELSPAWYDPQVSPLVPVSDFQEIDLIYDASGAQKDRRPHLHRHANLNELHPIKVGKRVPREATMQQMVFKQSLQVVHIDGLTFAFLSELARDLDQKKEMAMLGAGPKGNQPLVLREHGSPYRAFLYGEVEPAVAGTTQRYKLLLLLSDQELKLPESAHV